MNPIGQKIKSCRRALDLTQEQLAELLGVTYQAVSKWECGSASPDLAMIAPLTRLFGISADELLGLTKEKNAERRAYFDELCVDAWMKEDDPELFAQAKQAVAEFPDEMKYRNLLAGCYFYSAWRDPATFTETLDECIRLCLMVWERATDPELRYSALWTIVLSYARSGRKEQAREYAMLFPDKTGYANRDRALMACMEEEKLAHRQKMLLDAYRDFITCLREFSVSGDRDPCARQAVEVEHALEMVLCPADDDVNDFVYRKLAEFALADGDMENTIRLLGESKKRAVESNRRRTVENKPPLFDMLPDDPPVERPSETWVIDLWRDDVQRTFASLAGREDFEQLLNG